MKKRVVISLNPNQHPGAGNHASAGQYQENAHRQGQNQHHYGGLHGSFGYQDEQNGQNVHISQNNAGTSTLLPAVIPSIDPVPETPKKGFSLANLTNMANMKEIKGFVDRMGGLDGILATMTKVQKVVGSVSQMAPMVKVLFGSFGKKKSSSSDENNGEWKPKHRKRRKPGTGSGRPKGSAGRRRSGAKRRR